MKNFDFNKHKKLIGLAIALLVLFIGTLIYIKSGNEKPTIKNDKKDIFIKEEIEKDVVGKIEEKKKIFVDIKGEIKSPGVYELEEGAIVEDLVKRAGGLTEEGTLETTNRAKGLSNNEAIIIPSKKDIENKEAFIDGGAKVNIDGGIGAEGKININKASLTELQGLNGIGEGKANAIIEYREKNGGFKTIEDIKKVSGIGAATFDKIKDKICN